ncbi:MAG: OmpH family outer membrane protein [Sphingobium sp.]|nr:OmpH family outer membrane protein [Sphingobium sp.]
MRRLITVLALTTVATTAHAQTAAPAGGQAAQGLGGPTIPGVCLLSRQAVMANAKVAVAASDRLRALTQQAQQEIDGERQPVETDIKAFNAEAAKLPETQRLQRQQALQARLQPIEAKTRLRAREIDATREKALERISTELQPVVAQVYKQRQCGLLIDRNSVIGGNMANDLTAAVTQGLDAKISTITFNRETLPAEQAAAAPAR